MIRQVKNCKPRGKQIWGSGFCVIFQRATDVASVSGRDWATCKVNKEKPIAYCNGIEVVRDNTGQTVVLFPAFMKLISLKGALVKWS